MDIEYFRKKLKVILRDLSSFRDDELARELLRLAKTSDEDAVNAENEYLRQQLAEQSNVDVLVEALKVALGALGNAKFLMNKHLPEHSWNAGFDRDIKTVKQALATYQSKNEKE